MQHEQHPSRQCKAARRRRRWSALSPFPWIHLHTEPVRLHPLPSDFPIRVVPVLADVKSRRLLSRRPRAQGWRLDGGVASTGGGTRSQEDWILFGEQRDVLCVLEIPRQACARRVQRRQAIQFQHLCGWAYRRPAQNYAPDCKVIVLIGAGIGVAPFASVLTDLLDSLKQCACPKCGYSNPHLMRTRIKKVYFYWTVRSRSEASWFKHLLEAISLRDEDSLLDIHVNITGIKRADDPRTMMLRLAQYESGEPSTSDAHSRTVTRFGRIDWNEVFEKVKVDFPCEPSVGVFYCGPNTIAKILDKMCRQNSRGPTKFLFMKESFG